MIEQILIGEMWPLDRHFQFIAQLRGAADVVNMAVRDPDLLDRHVRLLDCSQDLRNVSTGIDNYSAARGVAPQQRAVLLEWRDRDDDCTGFGVSIIGCVIHARHIADFFRCAKRFPSNLLERTSELTTSTTRGSLSPLCHATRRGTVSDVLSIPEKASNGSGRPTP